MSRTTTDINEAKALPFGSVVLDREGEAFQRKFNGWVWGSGEPMRTDALLTPLTVLYEAEADA